MKQVLLILLLLTSSVFAANPFGLITSVEVSDFRSETYGSATIGKTIFGGPYFKLSDDISTFILAEYGTNKTETGEKAQVLSGFTGAAWDIFDLYRPQEIELGVLFELGASNIDVTTFDPTTEFALASGLYIKGNIKNSPVKWLFSARLATAKDIQKPAVGLSIIVPFKTSNSL